MPDGIGIVYNLGMGGCKVIGDLAAKSSALLTVHLQIPEQTIASTTRAATVLGTLELKPAENVLGCRNWNEPVWSSSPQPN